MWASEMVEQVVMLDGGRKWFGTTLDGSLVDLSPFGDQLPTPEGFRDWAVRQATSMEFPESNVSNHDLTEVRSVYVGGRRFEPADRHDAAQEAGPTHFGFPVDDGNVREDPVGDLYPYQTNVAMPAGGPVTHINGVSLDPETIRQHVHLMGQGTPAPVNPDAPPLRGLTVTGPTQPTPIGRRNIDVGQ